MQKYINNFANDSGKAIPGAQVFVYTFPDGLLARLYSTRDGGAVKENPLTTDSLGYFDFYAADGNYSITITSPDTLPITLSDISLDDAADGRGQFIQDGIGAVQRPLEKKVQETVSVDDYGAAGDGVADDTYALQSAINALQARGGGDLQVLGAYRFTTLTMDGTVNLVGIGQSQSRLIHMPKSSSDDGIVYAPSGSFRRPVIRNLSLLCSGEGRYGVSTPVNGAQFSGAFAIDFDRVSIRRENGAAAGWAGAVRLGDMVQGSFTKSEIRGGFNVANDPAGQKDTVGVIMEAATANIAVEFNGLQIVGCKTGIRLGENVEGYFGSSIEIVNCLDGIESTPVNSKPGGFISSVHLNVARYPINFKNRRDFSIGSLQLYRGSGHFNGAAEWKGLNFEACSRWSIANISVRVVPGYASVNTAYNLVSCGEFIIGVVQLGELNGINRGGRLSGCNNFTIGQHTFASGMANWFELVNSCAKGVIAEHMSADATPPAGAYSIDASSNRRDIKIDRRGSDRTGYDEVTYAGAITRTITSNQGGPVRVINLNAGTAAYTVDVILSRANCLAGDTATFRVVVAASTNPTLRFCDDVNTTVRHTIAGAVTAQWFEVTLVFNNAGWVIYKAMPLAA